MTDDVRLHDPWPDHKQQREGFAFGMWIFLASEIMFFGVLFGFYLIQRYRDPGAFAEAAKQTDAAIGVINTAILLASSCAVAAAEKLAEEGFGRAAKVSIGIALVLGLAFLGIKAGEYGEDLSHQLYPGAGFRGSSAGEIFWGFYWTSTLVHAAHLIIGVGLLLRLLLFTRAVRRLPSFRATALYWHFVDLVWIFLFPALYLVGRP